LLPYPDVYGSEDDNASLFGYPDQNLFEIPKYEQFGQKIEQQKAAGIGRILF